MVAVDPTPAGVRIEMEGGDFGGSSVEKKLHNYACVNSHKLCSDHITNSLFLTTMLLAHTIGHTDQKEFVAYFMLPGVL